MIRNPSINIIVVILSIINCWLMNDSKDKYKLMIKKLY